MPEKLTAGEVGVRLGIKPGMVRRYGLAFEAVTGVHIEVDPVRGRLYPEQVVEVLEAARAHLLQHPGGSVEDALRVVTGQEVPEGRALATQAPAGAPVRLPDELLNQFANLVQLNEEQHRLLVAQSSKLTDLSADLANATEVLGQLQGEVQVLRQTLEELTYEPQGVVEIVEREGLWDRLLRRLKPR